MQPPGHPLTTVRHGETEWSLSGRHTGSTDLPLLPEGEIQAESVRALLAHQEFAMVLTSPLLRARQTCDLAGLGEGAVIEPDLVEWDYGEYEGLTSAAIRAERPGWNLFEDGAPGGERPEDVAKRVDRVIDRVRSVPGPVACFAHGHVLRVLAARWLDLDPSTGRFLSLSPASLSELGYEQGGKVISYWNRRGQ